MINAHNSPEISIVSPSKHLKCYVFQCLTNVLPGLCISGPILEFKGSVRYVQKEHPTLVTNLTWFSKIDIQSKQLIQFAHTFSWYTAFFTIFCFLS